MKPLRLLQALLTAALFAQISMAAERPSAEPGAALLITNAQILDGTGTPSRDGAVRIVAGRIDAVGDLKPGDRVNARIWSRDGSLDLGEQITEIVA